MFDPLAIAVALACGMVARAVGLPALIGYLGAGFAPYEFGASSGPLLEEIAEIGVTLLLFSIGLKLKPAELLEVKVWGTTSVHMVLTIAVLTPFLIFATRFLPGVTLDFDDALLLGFALSFSSTVFAIQVLQERGEMASRHATLSIGILLIQDIAAVIFIAASTGKVPEWTALFLLLLIPLRPLIFRLLSLAGHDELFTLFGLMLAIGGAQLFELVSIKGDLGALILGALLAGDRKAKELAKNLLHFKDLFLVGFFVSIGLGGWPSQELVAVVILAGLLAPLKAPLYFWLMTRFHTPPRTALLSSAGLSNYSEFGLIVVALAAKEGMLDAQWLAAVSLAIAMSFLFSSAANLRIHEFYYRNYERLRSFQSRKLHRKQPDTSGVHYIVLGMGNIGAGSYRAMWEQHGREVLGVDDNDQKLAVLERNGYRLAAADASDPAFWLGIDLSKVRHVMLALTNHEENKIVGKLLRDMDYQGLITAIIRFEEESKELARYGISSFNLFQEAGAGFAAHADHLEASQNSKAP